MIFLLLMDHHYHENIDDDHWALWTCIWSTREATRAQAPGSRTKEKIRYDKYLDISKWFYDVWQGTSQSKQSIWEDKGVERIADLTVSYLDIKRLIFLRCNNKDIIHILICLPLLSPCLTKVAWGVLALQICHNIFQALEAGPITVSSRPATVTVIVPVHHRHCHHSCNPHHQDGSSLKTIIITQHPHHQDQDGTIIQQHISLALFSVSWALLAGGTAYRQPTSGY